MAHEGRGVLPAFLIVPPLFVALALCAVEGYRLVRPDAELFVLRPQSSLANAILHGTVEQAFAFIRDGQDPNALIAVQDPDFAHDRPMQVSPMVLAVAARQANVVTMLLGAGARIELPANALALCLADELGDDEVRGVLRPLQKDPLARCPEHVLEP